MKETKVDRERLWKIIQELDAAEVRGLMGFTVGFMWAFKEHFFIALDRALNSLLPNKRAEIEAKLNKKEMKA